MFPSRSVTFALLLAAFAAAQAARGQALADRIPADALVYAGWAGSDAVGPAYDTSRLKAFLDALALPQYFGERFKDALAAQSDPQQAQNTQWGVDLFNALAKSPTALYVGPFDFSVNPAKPVPRMALLSKIGADLAAKVAPGIHTSMQQTHKPEDPPAAAAAVGDFLVVTIGDADLSSRLAGNAPSINLTKVPAFQKAVVQLGAGAARSAAFLYVDGQGVVQMLQTAIQASPTTQNRELMPILTDGSGLNSLQQIAWAGNFGDDGGALSGRWHAATFVGMRDRRVGVMAFLDHPPLSNDALKLIPRSATSAGAFRFDGSRLLTDITAAAGKVDATTAQRLETVLHQVYVWTGVDLKRELFPAFGDEFIYYASPEAAGSSIRGFTLVNRLRDVKRAEAAVSALENYINLLILQRDPNSKLQFQTRPLPAPWDKVIAHELPLAELTPCWAIHEKTFFFSLSLAGLQSAMDMTAGSNVPTILDNPEFTALRSRLAPAGSPQNSFSSFSYAELGRAFPESYTLVSRILTAAQAQNPNPQSAYTLPPLNRIVPTLGPALSVYWSDAAGFHGLETSPFPLAGMLTPTQYVPLLVVQQIRQRQSATTQTRPATDPGLP